MAERERAREADRSGRRKDQRIVSIDEYNQRDPRGGINCFVGNNTVQPLCQRL